MAVSDLTNTTWVFNNSLTFSSSSWVTYYIDYNAENDTTDYDGITFNGTYNKLDYLYDGAEETQNAYNTSWLDQKYKTITITGGTDATNSNLISWLEANATQQVSIVNIVLGTNTINGVDTIKVKDSVDSSVYREFKYGTTPSTTTGIEVCGNTLTGVNSIVVKDTNNNNVTFGYDPPAPSGFNVTLDGTGHAVESLYFSSGYCKLNTAPSSSSDYDVKWSCRDYAVSSASIYLKNESSGTYTKTLSGVTKLYCWGDGNGGNEVKFNNVDISLRRYSDPYEVTISADSTFMVQASYQD